MRLPLYFRRSSSAHEAARLGLARSMTHSVRVCLGFGALFCPHVLLVYFGARGSEAAHYDQNEPYS
jgi:hypothetical protein